LNESLPPAEAAELEHHLAGCAGCRGEREATRLAFRLLATHPSAADLVAYTFGDLDERHRELVTDHLATCSGCRDEQALVAASRRLEASPGAERGAPWRRALLAAAAIIAIVAGTGWLATWQRWRGAEEGWSRRETALAERVAELERALRRPAVAATPAPVGRPERDSAAAAERLASLERELNALRQPQTGFPVVELLAEEMVLRGQAAAEVTLTSSRPATLLLVAAAIERGERYTLSAYRGERQVWQATVSAETAGELSLHLPVGSLPAGDYRLRARAADGETAATYRLRVD
jgi:hypothetical protein